MKGERPGQQPVTQKEQEQHNTWYEKVLEGVGDENKKAVKRLRSILSAKGGPQNLYFPCSGLNVHPILLAPPDTHHSFVDIGYAADETAEGYTAADLTEFFDASFQRIGANVVTAVPWEEA